MITLEKFQGHIILYCKSHYRVEDVDFITGLRRIWAVRCGHDVEHIDNSSDEYIANEMYRIIKATMPKKLNYFHEIVHKQLGSRFMFKDERNKTPLERLINIYGTELALMQVREKRNVYFKNIIKLPRPQRRLFNRILSGKGRYEDYKKVKA